MATSAIGASGSQQITFRLQYSLIDIGTFQKSLVDTRRGFNQDQTLPLRSCQHSYTVFKQVLGMSTDSGPKSLPFSLERIHVLLSDIEQELASIPDKSSRVQALKAEIDALKHTLRSSASDSSQVAQQLRGTHNALDDLVASIEGEILRDTPYVAELGRILGLV
jgi:hypothetical protein